MQSPVEVASSSYLGNVKNNILHYTTFLCFNLYILDEDNLQEPLYNEDADDSVDEIDTNNMAIYNAEVASSIKKEVENQELNKSGHKRSHQQAFDITADTDTDAADKRQSYKMESINNSSTGAKKLVSDIGGPVAGQSLLLSKSPGRGKKIVGLDDNFISALAQSGGSVILNSPSTSRDMNSIEKQLYGKDNYDLTNEMPTELFNSQVLLFNIW